MTRLAEQRGVTLIELLVAMTITTIVMGTVVFILTIFLTDSRYDTLRDQAQSDARSMVDRLSHELRSAASTISGVFPISRFNFVIMFWRSRSRSRS